ncbi:MAG: phenylacetate--CoA ligase, partial [Pseudomonadota bacterium]
REIETISREELTQLQLERLQTTINRALDKVSFYRQRFLDLDLEPGDVTSLDDLKELPFTTKDDLLEYTPYGLLAVPLKDIVRFHTSAGAFGRPCIAGYTRRDLAAWRELMARVMAAAGVTDQDIVQVAFAYGLHTGGAAFEMGAEPLGASVIPVSLDPVPVQINIMRDFRTTVLACTPSLALQISEALEDPARNSPAIDPKSLDLRLGLFGAEPWSEAVRRRLEGAFFIKAFDVYGLAEVIGPGVAGECPEKSGLHLAEDHFLPEIINPATGEVLPPGREGELVLTTLTREAQPLIRYRTGDLTHLEYDPCPCGRTHARLARMWRRTDDRIVFRGLSLLPQEVGRMIASFEKLRPEFEIIVGRSEVPDWIQVKVKVQAEAMPQDEAAKLSLADEISRALREATGVDFRVNLLPPGSLADDDYLPGRVTWK